MAISEDPMTGTPYARRDVPEGTTGFGFGELRFILSRHTNDAAAKTSAMLGLDETDEHTPVVQSAGASSLIARGLLDVYEADRARTLGEVAILEYTLTQATQWIGVALHSDTHTDAHLTIRTTDAAVVLQPREHGVWYATALNPELSDTDLTVELIAQLAQHYPNDTIGVTSQTLTGSASTYLTPTAAGWVHADEPLGPASPPHTLDQLRPRIAQLHATAQ